MTKPGIKPWSSQPQCDILQPRALTGPSKPRAAAAPLRNTESGCTQESANAGPPSEHNRNSDKKRRIPSRINPHCHNHPSTKILSGPGNNTGASNLQDHGRVSNNRTRPKLSRVSGNLLPPVKRGAQNTPLAARETRDLSPRGETSARGVTLGPIDTHPCALRRSVRDPVLCTANTRGREGPHLCQRHPLWPPPGDSGNTSVMAHPGRGHCPSIRRNGGPNVTPRPQASLNTPRRTQDQTRYHYPGIHCPPSP